MIDSDSLKGLIEALSKVFGSLPKPRSGQDDVKDDQTITIISVGKVKKEKDLKIPKTKLNLTSKRDDNKTKKEE